jgi:hypothetical protein
MDENNEDKNLLPDSLQANNLKQPIQNSFPANPPVMKIQLGNMRANGAEKYKNTTNFLKP